jgi:membrane protease YdiL (CAAX protease family)
LLRSGPANGLLAHAGLLLALVIIPTAVSLRLWKEPFSYSGWSPAGSGRLLALGLACGAGLMGLIVAVLWAAGAWSGALAPGSAGQAVGMILLSALLWITQSAHEEGLHRGYAFVQLSRALSFWLAAAIFSLLFVWGHVGHVGATPISLAFAGLFTLVAAYSLLRTGSLWFALGFHAAWNFTQSFVFGLANSGGSTPQALMTSHLQGPWLLTGGSAGPEGSLLAFPALAALAAVVHFGLPRRLS